MFEAFDFKPDTWANIDSIKIALDSIEFIGFAANQQEKATLILEYAKSHDEGMDTDDATKLRASVIGEDELFKKVAAKTKPVILCKLEDLATLECTELKDFIKGLDFFAFQSIAFFCKNPGFEVTDKFEDEIFNKVYDATDFSALKKALVTLKINDLGGLKGLLKIISKESETCPDLSITTTLEAVKNADAGDILKKFFDHAIKYIGDNPESVIKSAKREADLRFYSFLNFASIFKDDQNIFSAALTAGELAGENFEDIKTATLKSSLEAIDVEKGKEAVIAFVRNVNIQPFYKMCLDNKLVTEIKPVNVLNFIKEMETIHEVIKLIGYENTAKIISNEFPAYFQTFSTSGFFSLTCPSALESNAVFMYQMKQFLNDKITAMKGQQDPFSIWTKIAQLTKQKSKFMISDVAAKIAEIISANQELTVAEKYDEIMTKLMTEFVSVLNPITEKLSAEEFIKYLDDNSKPDYPEWLVILTSYNYFGIKPEGVDSVIEGLIEEEKISKDVMKNAFTETAKKMSFDIKDLIVHLAALTDLVTRMSHRLKQTHSIEVADTYSKAIDQLKMHYQKYFDEMLRIGANKTNIEAVVLLENECKQNQSAVNYFAENYFSLNSKCLGKEDAATATAWELTYLWDQVEKEYKSASLTVFD